MSSTGTILTADFAGVLGTAYFVYGRKESHAVNPPFDPGIPA